MVISPFDKQGQVGNQSQKKKEKKRKKEKKGATGAVNATMRDIANFLLQERNGQESFSMKSLSCTFGEFMGIIRKWAFIRGIESEGSRWTSTRDHHNFYPLLGVVMIICRSPSFDDSLIELFHESHIPMDLVGICHSDPTYMTFGGEI